MVTECIIAYRMNGRKVEMVTEDTEDVAVFPHLSAAVEYADSNKLFQSGQADYQIIVLDEL